MKHPLALALSAICPLAMAAGGHHAVDDAAILEPDECAVEAWLTGARAGEQLLYAGLGCRAGPLELAAATQRSRTPDASQNDYFLQAKWAGEIGAGFSVGASITPAWQARARPRLQGSTVAGLLTWSHDSLALHANLGRNLLPGAADTSLWGVAAEWAPHPDWSLLAERYKADETHFVRWGLRWSGGEQWSVDLSRAHRLRGPEASTWTLGLTWVFERPRGSSWLK